ncbi:rhomboid family intramembrane serine protease [Poseidonocella sedimentorum]|uniref:Membrane associated serine protease, rhomboid family n=1 Tax=Poseidonocella sedimentorum TaxID=871652 RepID=A0A1I6ENA7_9RHOB|nr:rhomboid family intramembrane serine protease [Poseidonocella sedimentorum]SFR19263.1 Membrane associated serine protease, rhomboid family [Poseidonocella sedimentorum]
MSPPAPPWRNAALLVIAGSCVLVEALLMLSDLGLLGPPRLRQTVYEYAGFWPGLLDTWQPNYPLQPYAMFLTYAFLHSGPVHMAVNMLTLISLSAPVVARVGRRGFVMLYVAAVLGGGLGFGLLAETVRPMVGASGGLFGLAGGILAWNYVDRFTARERLWPVLRGVAWLLLLNLVLWWLMNGLLAWETHLGGFVFGWITALLIDPRGQPPETDGTGAGGGAGAGET